MTPEEWDGTPWWQQRVYIEGYEAEGILDTGEEVGPAESEEQAEARANVEDDPANASDDDFRAMGLTVIDGGG